MRSAATLRHDITALLLRLEMNGIGGNMVLYGGRYRWAEGVNGDEVDSWVQIFLREGYELTDSRDHEAGYEKVAIYIDLVKMQPSHVAKSDGTTWKSKLGKLQDIEHSSLDVLEGDQHCEYGIVERILRRPL